MQQLFQDVYKNRRVLITGHTGFKGSWLSLMLHKFGADIYGYALAPSTNPNLFNEAKIHDIIKSYIGDVRDLKYLRHVLNEVQPEIVIHMAAQPLVRESYKNPVETYEINVMGSVHLFEACRSTPSVKAIVNVTTDKCYENQEWHWGYRENEPMGGYDPYSNSKGCSELVTAAYRNSFFNAKDYDNHGVAIASARAGNVIGGGDWADDRLIPDFIKAISQGEQVLIRSPHAVRPWQHVLEPLTGYLVLAAKLFQEGKKYNGGWNFGPNDSDAKSVGFIIEKICELWGNNASFQLDSSPQPHEANFLKLDCSKAKTELDWNPKWDILTTLKKIVDWNKAFLNGENMSLITFNQINDYCKF